jgi:hypothetical protein
MIRNTMYRQVGNGLFVLGGEYVDLYYQIQEKTKSFIKDVFDGEELLTPTILSPENTIRSNYTKSFSNQTQMVHRHLDGSEIGMNSPTVCYHMYAYYEDDFVDGNKTHILTGKCNRFEEGELNDLTRLLQFTGQEIVHIGSYDYVEDCFAKSVEYVRSIFEYMDLDYKFEGATDPFFGKDSRIKKRSQRIHGSKVEYKLYFPNEKQYLPVGSFNFVGTSYHKRFNIINTQTDDPASGCWGWGLERLMYALVSQKGEDVVFNYPVKLDDKKRNGYKNIIENEEGWYRLGSRNYWFAENKMENFKEIDIDFKDIEFEVITDLDSLDRRKVEILRGLEEFEKGVDWNYNWTWKDAERRIKEGHILKIAFHNGMAVQWDWYFTNSFIIKDHDSWSAVVNKLPKDYHYSAHWYCHPKYRSSRKYPTFIKDFISASYNWSYNNGYTTDVNYQDGWNWKSIKVVKKIGHVGRNWLDEFGTVK